VVWGSVPHTQILVPIDSEWRVWLNTSICGGDPRATCDVHFETTRLSNRKNKNRGDAKFTSANRCIQPNSPFGVDRYQNLCVGDGSPDHFISLALLEGCSSRAKEFFSKSQILFWRGVPFSAKLDEQLEKSGCHLSGLGTVMHEI